MGLNNAAMLAACAGLACAQSIDWATISPAEAGLEPAKLASWRSGLAAHRTTGLIVIRRGRIAMEWYAPEWNADRPHGTASMAKALVGGMSLVDRTRALPLTVSGLVKAQQGSISYQGERIDQLPPHQIVARGLAQVPEGQVAGIGNLRPVLRCPGPTHAGGGLTVCARSPN